MLKSILVTGHNGEIGKAIVSAYKDAGYFTIGIDIVDTSNADANIKLDLEKIVNDDKALEDLVSEVSDLIIGKELSLLVNNAAVQILGGIKTADLKDFTRSLNINLTVPFILSKSFFNELSKAKGSIINIGSIHSETTKSKFISYATSKSALKGLTRSMAVDFGQHVRVNMIQPAAINTTMLREGFENSKQLEELKNYHPSKTIGQPEEVAKAAIFLGGEGQPFLNGCFLNLDGGISGSLHDPDNGQN